MAPSSLGLANILRAQGATNRQANTGHLSLGQLKVMATIEQCPHRGSGPGADVE